MKKRNLKSLELNKKTVSNFEVYALKAGLASIGRRCTQPTWCGSVRVTRGAFCNDQGSDLCAAPGGDTSDHQS